MIRFGVYSGLAFVLSLLLGVPILNFPLISLMMLFFVLAHETLHMIPLTLLTPGHTETFRLMSVEVDAADLTLGKLLVVVATPFLFLIPFGYVLYTSLSLPFVIIGLTVMIIHLALIPLEFGSALILSKRKS